MVGVLVCEWHQYRRRGWNQFAAHVYEGVSGRALISADRRPVASVVGYTDYNETKQNLGSQSAAALEAFFQTFVLSAPKHGGTSPPPKHGGTARAEASRMERFLRYLGKGFTGEEAFEYLAHPWVQNARPPVTNGEFGSELGWKLVPNDAGTRPFGVRAPCGAPAGVSFVRRLAMEAFTPVFSGLNSPNQQQLARNLGKLLESMRGHFEQSVLFPVILLQLRGCTPLIAPLAKIVAEYVLIPADQADRRRRARQILVEQRINPHTVRQREEFLMEHLADPLRRDVFHKPQPNTIAERIQRIEELHTRVERIDAFLQPLLNEWHATASDTHAAAALAKWMPPACRKINAGPKHANLWRILAFRYPTVRFLAHRKFADPVISAILHSNLQVS